MMLLVPRLSFLEHPTCCVHMVDAATVWSKTCFPLADYFLTSPAPFPIYCSESYKVFPLRCLVTLPLSSSLGQPCFLERFTTTSPFHL